MGYTPAQEEAIRIAMDVALSFSIAGSLFIVVMYVLFPDLRAFAFRLVVMMSLADLGKSVSYLLPTSGASCYVAAAGDTFCSLASLLWTSTISLSLYITVVRNNPAIEKYQKYFHMYCWGLPLVITPLPFSTSNYGQAQGWCWISASKDQLWLGTLWRMLAFYGPLWLICPFNVFSLGRVIQVIKFSSNAALQEDADIRDILIRRLRFYPAILIVCYTPVSLKRIYDIIDPTEENFTLAIVSIVFLCLNGFCNALVCSLRLSFFAISVSLVYGLTDSVKEALISCFTHQPRSSRQLSDDSISLSHRVLYDRKTSLY